MEKQFLRHEQCPVCGSHNNVAVYYNTVLKGETYFCHTPGCSHVKTDNDLAREKETAIECYPLTDEALAFMNIGRDVAESYYLRGHNSLLYFYSKLPNGKVRNIKKRDFSLAKEDEYHFTWVNKGSTKGLLYGMQTRRKGDTLVLTVGERDALAAKNMLGSGYCCVSIMNGDDSVDAAIKQNIEWIDSFTDIVIAFDNDENGMKAADKAVELLGHKARIAVLPRYVTPAGFTKDARDFNENNLANEFINTVANAPERVPEYIIPLQERINNIFEFLNDDEARTGYSTGLPSLDKDLGGIRRGELSVLFGDPSTGKSSLGRFLMCALALQNVRCMYITLEESQAVADTRLIEIMHGIRLIDSKEEITREKIAELMQMVSSVVMTRFTGVLDRETLLKSVEYAIKRDDTQFVLLDHITAATDWAGEQQQQEIRQILLSLNNMAIRYKCHVMVISHTRREQASNKLATYDAVKPPSIRDAFGSSAIEQYAHVILALQNNTRGCLLWLLKNRMHGAKSTVALTFNGGVYGDAKAKTVKWKDWVCSRSNDRIEPRDTYDATLQASDTEPKQICGVHEAIEVAKAELGIPDERDSIPSSGGVLETNDMAAGLHRHEDGQTVGSEGSVGRGSTDEDRSIYGATPIKRFYSMHSVCQARPPHPSRKETGVLHLGGETGAEMDDD